VVLRDLALLVGLARDGGWEVLIDVGVDTSKPAGKTVANLVGALDELERRRRSEQSRKRSR
jgi:hypothetical protein